MSLCDSIMQRLSQRVDVLVFNPPYVPTLSEEAGYAQQSRGIQGAWAGGLRGMEVTDQVLDLVGVRPISYHCTILLTFHFQKLLSDRGVFYLVAVKHNGIQAIRTRMLEEHQLSSEVCHPTRLDVAHALIRPSASFCTHRLPCNVVPEGNIYSF